MQYIKDLKNKEVVFEVHRHLFLMHTKRIYFSSVDAGWNEVFYKLYWKWLHAELDIHISNYFQPKKHTILLSKKSELPESSLRLLMEWSSIPQSHFTVFETFRSNELCANPIPSFTINFLNVQR